MNRKHYLLVEVAPRLWNKKPFMTKALLVYPGPRPPPSNWLPPKTLQALIEIFGDELRSRLAARKKAESEDSIPAEVKQADGAGAEPGSGQSGV